MFSPARPRCDMGSSRRRSEPDKYEKNEAQLELQGQICVIKDEAVI